MHALDTMLPSLDVCTTTTTCRKYKPLHQNALLAQSSHPIFYVSKTDTDLSLLLLLSYHACLYATVVAAIDECTGTVRASHDRYVELGRVREELQRRAKTLDVQIAACDSELKAGVRHRPPPIVVEMSDEDYMSPWDETPVHSPRNLAVHSLRKSPHHLLRSAANSVDYSSPRSSVGSIKEDVLMGVLASSMDTLHD